MHNRNMVADMSLISQDEIVCDICQFGKQRQKSFPIGQAQRTTRKSQLVHTVICNPMKSNPLKGSKYFFGFSLMSVQDFVGLIS